MGSILHGITCHPSAPNTGFFETVRAMTGGEVQASLAERAEDTKAGVQDSRALQVSLRLHEALRKGFLLRYHGAAANWLIEAIWALAR